MNISGNTILITGGGAGIGRALALALQARGNRILVAGRTMASLEEVAAQAPDITPVRLDVADANEVAAFGAKMAADHPRLNVVIHNAGIMQPEDLLGEPFDLTSAEATVAINLLGPIRLTAALLPQLRRQPNAAILTVSSGLAFVPLAATPTYSATKAAIHSWSQSLRHQLAPAGIDVIEVAPPAVATDLMPGHAQNPNSMPLDEYITETVALLEAHPTGPENTVRRVAFLRRAEAEGRYDAAFAAVNGAH